jgi:hypothetical protein
VLAVQKAGGDSKRGVFRILVENAGCRDARVREGSPRDPFSIYCNCTSRLVSSCYH